MQPLRFVLRVVGVVQVVLGLLYLFVPIQFLGFMGSAVTQPDIAYPLGMLAARFMAYGIGMFYIARAPEKHIFWINNMILVQVVDLAVGVLVTLTGVVALSHSAFPMFNATIFIMLLLVLRPRQPIASGGAGLATS